MGPCGRVKHLQGLRPVMTEQRDHTHPTADEPAWDDPDFCPFCGTRLPDGGPGFIAHIEDAATCRARFDAWRENIVDDIGGEWSG